MTISKLSCQFELFIVNDDRYTDYDLGDMLSEPVDPGEYDCFSEDVGNIAEEIFDELNNDVDGQCRFVIEVEFEYTRSYDYYGGGWEYDVDFTYKVISKEPTTYFDDLVGLNEKYEKEEES